MKVAIILSIAALAMFVGIVVGVYYVTSNNAEIRLRNTITAKQSDNKNEYDNMWKKISQVAQVAEKDRQSLTDIFVKYAEARTGNAGAEAGGAGNDVIVKWVNEAIPNVSSDVMKNLTNVIVASRDSWTMRQKELIAIKNERNILIEQMPSCWFIKNKDKIVIQIVTSSKTVNAFETGTDDDVKVFDNGK